MTNEELLTTLKAVRGLFANNSPFYIKKLGAPITNGDQSRIDAVFIAVDAAIASEGAPVSASPQPRCPKCQGINLALYSTDDGFRIGYCNNGRCKHKGEMSQFFAAAPAQEPRANATIHDKLQPCPFCGCLASMNAHGHVFRGLPGYRVECEGDCHAMTCYWHTEDQALTAWNRRAAQEQPVENSPCTCGFLRGSSAVGSKPCPKCSPQKGKP